MTHILLSFPRSLIQGRYRIVAGLWATCLVVFTLLRLVLAVSNASAAQWTVGSFAHSFTLGFAYDAGVATVLCIPFGLLLALLPSRLIRSPLVKVLAAAVIFAGAFALLFDALAEWLFWDEFSTRFNFIAVDYLVYTNEVLGNIRQSYPVVPLLAIIGVLSLLFAWGLRPAIHRTCDPLEAHSRWKALAAHACLGTLLMIVLSGGYREAIANAYAREISGNGLFELMRAFKDNELEYERFYATLPRQQAQSQSMDERALSGWTPFSADADDLRMRVTGEGTELRPNVVIICMESMSADYMRTFGNDKNLTPNLDRLAGESMFFSRTFASGTRTVRGLEALALSVPPTPGSSIVRRPRNENLFSLASVFNAKGYKSRFVYGGYGYFDNMNYFFANNGYEATDRTSVESGKIHHENVWGIADEDLFTKAMELFDEDARAGKPFFAHIMTTSNHRPYTYPEGRIGIPSKSGRDGAVKYADWAVGDFLKRAQSKSWFANTVFVIVADHQASSAGKTDLPVARYRIPLMLYAPKIFPAQKVERLMAQIDVAPTLLGLFNWSYTTKFFGHDLNKIALGEEHALISTYQKVGYIEDDKLVILEPGKKVRVEAIDWKDFSTRPAAHDAHLVEEAISNYQSASSAFREGRMGKD